MKKIIPVILILISACFIILTYVQKPYNNFETQIQSHNNNYAENYANENNFTYKNISDSEIANITETNPEYFSYNENNNEIEITDYNGPSGNIVIPEKINNKPVTTISMKLKDMPHIVYVPITVIKINSIINENLNNYFYLVLIIELAALIIALISCFILNRKKNKDKTVYIAFLYVLSVIYLLIINILAYSDISKLPLLSIIITIIYLALFIALYSVKNRLYNYDKQVNNIQKFIDKALEIAKKINDNDLLEAIKYSDPISNAHTQKIEEEILDKLKQINNENKQKQIDEILTLIEDRNIICKKTKGN